MGPTAVGKTSLAIKLAKTYHAEIFSSDSRQVFKEMNIGTAKITDEEMDQVQHHFINTRSIADDYSAGKYEEEIIDALGKYFQVADIAILCGGTGLYIDAVIKGLDKFPKVTSKEENQIKEIFEKRGIEGLQAELKNLDPEYYQLVDLQNSRRLSRALQVICASGKKYSSFLNQQKPKREFETINILLERPRDELYERINQRVDSMLHSGLLEEAKNLHKQSSLRSLQTVGYKELFAFFDKQYDLETATAEIKKNTRRYAKRQITWFKKYNAFITHPDKQNEILNHIKSQLTS